MPDQIVHIGYPKTATTFLQRNVFPYLQDTNYIDFRACESLFLPVIYLDDLDFNLNEVEEKLKGHISNKIDLFSFEALTGAPFIYKGLGRSRIPHRLKELGFNKVIITIRDQSELIDSMYRQYIIQGGVVKFKKFLNQDAKIGLYRRSFNLNYLNYYDLINYYAEVFGKENILVLSHSMLVSDEQNYLDRIADFTGVQYEEERDTSKENTSLSNLSINLLRIVNHFILTSQKPNHLIWNRIETKYVSKVFKAILDPYLFRFFSSRKSYASVEQLAYVSATFEKSNNRLLEEYDLGEKI